MPRARFPKGPRCTSPGQPRARGGPSLRRAAAGETTVSSNGGGGFRSTARQVNRPTAVLEALVAEIARHERGGLGVILEGAPGPERRAFAEALADAAGRSLRVVEATEFDKRSRKRALGALLAEAEALGAILFFDEADALFGRRTEIADAHVRFSEAEIGFFLKRLDETEGVAILATNARTALDEALIAQMQAVLSLS